MARSKQERRKKTAPAQTPAPQAENSPETREHAAAPPRKTAPPHDRPTARHGGMARTSTLLLTAGLCLLLGTYLGTLLPAFRSFTELVSAVQQSLPQQQQMPSPAGRGADDHLKRLEEAVGKNPQDLHAWIQLGNQYFDDHKPREAIRAYERALGIKGDNPDALTDMGIMYRQLGEFERAAELFTQASTVNPRHEQSRFNLGVVLFFDLKRKEEARNAWRALIAINPEAKTPDGALLRTMLDELR
jgi:cytochrome c-type biogenesis protein CcmH/NrfG